MKPTEAQLKDKARIILQRADYRLMTQKDISKLAGHDIPAPILGWLEANGEIERAERATGDLFRWKPERPALVTGDSIG
jgi:hypothetical protein